MISPMRTPPTVLLVSLWALLAMAACRSTPEGTPGPGPESRPAAQMKVDGMLRLPDGSFIPNLNGVTEPMVWTYPGDFSPITAIRASDKGVEWWVHENGMLSTTLVVEGTFSGKPIKTPVLQVAVPAKPKEQKPIKAP